eukprot:640624-Pelagomonas_calceolata.AAC.3
MAVNQSLMSGGCSYFLQNCCSDWSTPDLRPRFLPCRFQIPPVFTMCEPHCQPLAPLPVPLPVNVLMWDLLLRKRRWPVMTFPS